MMVNQTPNDNESPRVDRRLSGPDAHGQAAMLLVESLMHGLIERSVISVRDAIDIVGTAAEVKLEIADDLGDSQATMEKSLAILGAIQASLKIDHTEDTIESWPPTR